MGSFLVALIIYLVDNTVPPNHAPPASNYGVYGGSSTSSSSTNNAPSVSPGGGNGKRKRQEEKRDGKRVASGENAELEDESLTTTEKEARERK